MFDYTPEAKKCRVCKQVKPLAAFHIRRDKGKVTYRNDCIDCLNERHRKHYQDHKAEYVERINRYRTENPEWYRKYLQQHRTENEERYRQQAQQYYQENKQLFKERGIKWRQQNPEKTRQHSKRWRSRNPQHTRINNARRRALVVNAEGTHTIADIKQQYSLQRGYCWWCEKPLNGKYHVDHRIPLNRGGTNWPDNLVCACPKCNLSRRDKLPHEWNGRLL